MAAQKHITNFQVYSYLAYFVARSKRNRVEFDALPYELADAKKNQILLAFDAMRENKLVERFVECEDGVVFVFHESSQERIGQCLLA